MQILRRSRTSPDKRLVCMTEFQPEEDHVAMQEWLHREFPDMYLEAGPHGVCFDAEFIDDIKIAMMNEGRVISDFTRAFNMLPEE